MSWGTTWRSAGHTQLRIAETEKYAHVTFFFSGGREALFPGEDRELIQSPDVATYDLQPEMSAAELTDRLVEAIESRQYDLIVCNYANGDMVGHTGVFAAAVKAVETLDHCLGRVEKALLATGGQALVTADHGNCEQMTDSGVRPAPHPTHYRAGTAGLHRPAAAEAGPPNRQTGRYRTHATGVDGPAAAS